MASSTSIPEAVSVQSRIRCREVLRDFALRSTRHCSAPGFIASFFREGTHPESGHGRSTIGGVDSDQLRLSGL